MIVDKKTRFEKIKNEPTSHYLSNKTLLALLEEYKESGKISNELGLAFLLLSKKMSNASNFRGYTYVDEFVQDGVECCLKYCHNFNPDISKNPFGYFSQFVKYAFVNRIKKENNYSKLKRVIQKYDQDGYLFDEEIICNSLDRSEFESGVSSLPMEIEVEDFNNLETQIF